ncbi:MAG: pyruvate dehydrogenase complex dihydrolipoamide acetyltransferase [Pseudomonadota bacterium]
MPVKILMPALSPTMTEGNLVKWLKKEGDEVESGQVLAEIETDKATMEVEAVDEGKLARIIVPEGTEAVKVNAVIGIILEEGEDESALEGMDVESTATPAPKEAPAKPTSASPQVATVSPTEAQVSGDRIIASPLAKRIATQAGLALGSIQGSGPRGRIVKADVEAALQAGPAARRAEIPRDEFGMPSFERVEVSNIRKVIAGRLTESKQTVPHFYLTIECEMDKLLDLRQQINATLDDEKVSVNDVLIRACALALQQVPEANAAWMGDHVRQYKAQDISVAVAVDYGLVTPIVKDAGQKTILEISRDAKQLIAKARAGKLKPQEFQGGTFSISNMGMYGLQDFSAIINPPQACILAVSAAKQSPVVIDGDIGIATLMKCTLSVDHRVVDGAIGAEFLQALKTLIENPVQIVIRNQKSEIRGQRSEVRGQMSAH